MLVVESEGVNECVSEGVVGEEVIFGWFVCMVLVFFFIYEWYSNVYFVGLVDMMK